MNEIVISLAKAAILVALGQPDSFELEKALDNYPSLEKKGAVFVTINTKSTNHLRGCIGSLQAHRPLYKDIIYNAQSAALRDPRFKPLRIEELDNITLEVAILNEPKPLYYKDIQELEEKITPFKDGIVLSYKGKRATYLPSVWEDLPKFDDFFTSLCHKAELQSDCLTLHPYISTYQVTKYKESDVK
jgi:AmmeMemoRadiSam system protein A